MRALLGLSLAAVAWAVACPLAPAPLAGLLPDAGCSTDLECGDGLRCECGTCATPGAIDQPPSCRVEPPGCPIPASSCFDSCDGGQPIGDAVCVEDVETCDGLDGGVLRTDCPDGTCFGTPAAGATCVDGSYVCAAGTAADGRCLTTDCTTTDDCVASCASTTERREALCIESTLTCADEGFPVFLSGCTSGPRTCPLPRPTCRQADCVARPGSDQSAICNTATLEYSCTPFVGLPERSDLCDEPDEGGEGDDGE